MASDLPQTPDEFKTTLRKYAVDFFAGAILVAGAAALDPQNTTAVDMLAAVAAGFVNGGLNAARRDLLKVLGDIKNAVSQ